MRKYSLGFGVLLSTALLSFATAAASRPNRLPVGATAHAAINPGHSVAFGVRTLSSGCRLRGRLHNLPDPRCTPGAYFSRANKSMICVRGYSSKVRNVSAATKLRVYSSYGIYSPRRGQYEVDHLVPLEGGGSNAIENLFPEPANPQPGFHQKDRLENQMRSRVCYRNANLRATQRQIARNWTTLWNAWF